MTQTAVEWLFEQVANTDWKNLLGEEKIKIFEQAKELEKQQIIDAWVATDNELQRIAAEQYYNKTFKKK